jgi:solute carrier family 25 S-adenosylmethionine transporter 26
MPAGAFFTTYEGVKSTFTKYNPTLSGSSSPLLPQPIIHSAASSIAELVSCAILTPAEVIKQNAQMVDTAKGEKTNATLQTLAKFRSNPLALWRGYTALAGRNLPFTALQFPIFERLKQAIKQHREDRGTRTNTLLENGLITAASAGSAGAFAAVVTTPVDVVKTRIMLAAASSAADDQGNNTKTKSNGPVDAMGRSIQSKGEGLKEVIKNSKEGLKDAIQNVAKPVSRKGSIQIAREIIADQGVIKGLFRGGALRAVWTLIGSGLYLGVYESGRVYLAQRRGEDIDNEDI